jgi:hypothetical protein
MADNNEDELVDYDEEEVRRDIAVSRQARKKQKQIRGLRSFVTPSFNPTQLDSIQLNLTPPN